MMAQLELNSDGNVARVSNKCSFTYCVLSNDDHDKKPIEIQEGHLQNGLN